MPTSGRQLGLALLALLLSSLSVSLSQTSYVKLSNSSFNQQLHQTSVKSRLNNPIQNVKFQAKLSANFSTSAATSPTSANSNQQTSGANSPSSEKICIGTSNGLAEQHNKTDHLHNLAERYKNCTYVMGNLEITWLDSKADLSFLESIREITGYLLIGYVEVERIRMPNLQIIRGRELFKIPKSATTEFALFAIENKLIHLELSNFREILVGSVGFYYNQNLCHTRINWDEIINWPTYRTDFRYEGNQPECSPCDSACHGFCWGDGPEMCQKFSKTNCAEQCGGGRCFGVGPRECCHLFCAAGCTGPERTDCLACRTFYNDGECIQECPPMQRYNPSKFLWEHNPLGKYAFGGKCVTECPGHLLRDNGACVRTCPPNKKPNTNGECVPCSGPCQKECQGVDVIHSGNIDQLVNCTVIEGSLTILESSFAGGLTEVAPNGTIREHLQAMHPDKLEVLKNIREITGYLNIQANHKDFKNLSYFRNLQTIGGRQTTDMFHSLSIIKSSLITLNLRSLKRVKTGRIIIEDNKQLCLADSINWRQLNVTNQQDITIRGNADPEKCQKLQNLTCHKQCSQDGCWGSGPDECLSCKNYKLEVDQICVENCQPNSIPPSPQLFSQDSILATGSQQQLAFDAGRKSCKRCHPECKSGCNGTEAIHCWRCKNVKDGPYCVSDCPSHKYNRNGLCEECDRSCVNGCSGPSNRLGEGGCNACGKTVFTSSTNETLQQNNHQLQTPAVAYCIRADEPCPEGYYQEYHFSSEHLQAGGLKVSPGKPVCRKCHHRCKSCTGLGTHVSVCDCAKYVAGEQCEDFCPRDYFANEALGQCFKCSPECNGCFGPTEADCLSCRVYRIYRDNPTFQANNLQDHHHAEAISLTTSGSAGEPFSLQPEVGFQARQQGNLKFNCTAQCPPDKPHRISESNMLDPYCSEDPGIDLDGNPRIVALTTSTSILLIMIISSLVMVCFSIYRCQIEKDKTVKLTMHLSGIDDVEPLTPSNLKPNLAPLRSIKETELRKGNILGSGFGGTVYQGFWYPEGSEQLDRKARPVAIKVLRDNGQPNMNKEFLDEAYIMASVNHPNLVRLLAVCMTPNHLMLVTQLMPLGCLLEYVKKYKNDIGPKNLLEWCKQIAKGMAYLEEHRMVHRDLALRNVLLQTCGRALISDFGLAKFLEIDQSEYSHTGGGRLPIRWLAPECIRERKFTHKSDVWAFGVTVWELLTFGRVPFEEYDTKQVPMEIEKGARLQQPAYMSAEVYKVIYSCWFYQPEKRPSFSALAQDFSKFARDPGRYLICGPSKAGIDYKPFVVQSPSSARNSDLTESCDEFNNSDIELDNSTEEECSPTSAGIPPDLTPSTHNRINENRFAFELSRQQQLRIAHQQQTGNNSDPEQSPLSTTTKRLSATTDRLFAHHPNHLHHHHHHHHHLQHQDQVFEESQAEASKLLADPNNNTIGFVAGGANFRWQANISSNSIGHRSSSEQPTDMYDYLMPSPIVDDLHQTNFNSLYATGGCSAHSLTSGPQTSQPNNNNNAKQPPHSAGLIGVNNEEYFLTYVNNSFHQLHNQRNKSKRAGKRRLKRKSESYDVEDEYDNDHLLAGHATGNAFDMTDTPSTSSTASTLSASNNLLERRQRCQKAALERSRKLSASNGNMPQSLV